MQLQGKPTTTRRQKGKEDSLLEPPEEVWLPRWHLDFARLSSRTIRINCCLEPPGLWEFITAVIGNWYTSPVCFLPGLVLSHSSLQYCLGRVIYVTMGTSSCLFHLLSIFLFNSTSCSSPNVLSIHLVFQVHYFLYYVLLCTLFFNIWELRCMPHLFNLNILMLRILVAGIVPSLRFYHSWSSRAFSLFLISLL